MLMHSETKTFVNIFDDYDTFKDEYDESAFNGVLTNTNLEILYYILYSRYGNSPIVDFDENQFKYKLFSIIWQYGPTWQKRLDIQKEIRDLQDITQGSFAIYNSALNPSTEPSTDSDQILPYINQQNTTRYKKTPMDAYGQLWDLLAIDVTEQFINRFKPLFKQFIAPYTYLYESEED